MLCNVTLFLNVLFYLSPQLCVNRKGEMASLFLSLPALAWERMKPYQPFRVTAATPGPLSYNVRKTNPFASWHCSHMLQSAGFLKPGWCHWRGPSGFTVGSDLGSNPGTAEVSQTPGSLLKPEGWILDYSWTNLSSPRINGALRGTYFNKCVNSPGKTQAVTARSTPLKMWCRVTCSLLYLAYCKFPGDTALQVKPHFNCSLTSWLWEVPWHVNWTFVYVVTTM